MRRNQGIANDLGLKDNDPSNNKLPTNFTSASHLNTLHPRNNNLRQANDHENFLRRVLSFNELPYAQISNVGKRKQSSFGYSQCLNSVQKAGSQPIIRHGHNLKGKAVMNSHLPCPLPAAPIERHPLSDITSNSNISISSGIGHNMSVPKRGRGRPRKNPVQSGVVTNVPQSTIPLQRTTQSIKQ
ncbi:hypothetical protein Tco_0327584 [Tanacetum coccineum]